MKNKNTITANKSLIKNLKDQNQISDELLVCINSLSLENLIAIKLELCANHINNRLYGFDIWRKTSYIVKDALLKFAISTTKSKKDAARFLGLTSQDFYKACKKFEINQHFQ
tara:strand:+ start:140 stop:475 length:336 start_codon:yes stop_codon:yes gene_type:complete